MLRCSLLRCALLFTFYLPLGEVGVTAQDGTLLWQFPVGGSMSKCPAIDEDGVVYISAPDKNVHALNGETGELLWSYPTEMGTSTAPVLGPDGTVYVGLSGARIVALNGETRELLWETVTSSEAGVLGLVNGNTLLAYGAGVVLAVDVADGEELWQAALKAGSYEVALAPTGSFFLTAEDMLRAVDAATGEVVSEVPFVSGGASGGFTALGGDGTAYRAGRDWDGRLCAADIKTGALWCETLPGVPAQWPLVIGPDGTVYVATGNLLALNPCTREIKWAFATEYPILLSPAIAEDGTIYVGSRTVGSGNLHAIEAATGLEKWRFPAAILGPPTIGPGGVIYVAAMGGTFYAVKGSAPLANSPWPKWQQNMANTGQSHWPEGTAGIIGQSEGMAVAEGERAQFWVSARGALPLAYQWFREGEPIPGATSNRLVLAGVGVAEAGRYHAVVSNAQGSVTSEPMDLIVGCSLTVDWYPSLGTILGVPENRIVPKGATVVLEAQPAEESEFIGWGGDVDSAENPITLEVNQSLRVRAEFRSHPGELLWMVETGSLERGCPAISRDGNVFVATPSGVLAISRFPGEVRWKLPLSFQRGSSPVLDGSELLFCADSRQLVALRQDTGQVVWQKAPKTFAAPSTADVPDPVTLSRDGRVFWSAEDGFFYCLDANTGAEIWTIGAMRRPMFSPAVLDERGRLYVGEGIASVLSCLDALTGEKAWSYRADLPVPVMYSPAVGKAGEIYFIGGMESSWIYQLETGSGSENWVQPRTCWIRSSPVISTGGTVYQGTGAGEGSLLALDAVTGEEQWAFPAGDCVDSSPAVVEDGTVYFGSDDGRCYAVNGQSGEMIWSYQTGAPVRCSPNVAPDGTVYIGSNDGRLYAFAGTAPLADTPWPKFRADMQNSGRVNLPPAASIEVQLLGVALREDGAFVFEVQGPPSAELLLQESENLRDWSDADTVVLNESGRAGVVGNSPASETVRFYRVRVVP